MRFPSTDALVHTEIKASPIRDVIDDRSFDLLLEGAREALAPLCAAGGEIAFALTGHAVLARKS